MAPERRCPLVRWGGPTLPRVPLGRWPTPIRRLQLGSGDLPVKDEGQASPIYGGNKVRKLERSLAVLLDTLGPGGTVVTGGAAGSHHVLATALHAARVGLRTHAILGPQATSSDARLHLRLSAAHCAAVTPAARPRDLPGLLRAAAQRPPRRAGLLPLGGSDGPGVLGGLDLALEMLEDHAAGRLARLSEVVVPFGSGGTALGLAAGFAFARRPVRVRAVRVSPRAFGLRARLRRLLTPALEMLGPTAPTLEDCLARLSLETVTGDPGYARPFAAASDAVAHAASADLVLEPTYSGRALAWLRARPRVPGRVLVATANRVHLADRVRDAPELEPRLHHLLHPAAT